MATPDALPDGWTQTTTPISAAEAAAAGLSAEYAWAKVTTYDETGSIVGVGYEPAGAAAGSELEADNTRVGKIRASLQRLDDASATQASWSALTVAERQETTRVAVQVLVALARYVLRRAPA